MTTGYNRAAFVTDYLWLGSVVTHCAYLIGRNVMSKSNLEDGVADAIAATALISIGLTTLIIWLGSFPS